MSATNWPFVLNRGRSDSFNDLESYLKSLIRTIPDFPKPNSTFRDITTLLLNPDGFKATIDAFERRYKSMGITHVVSCEVRGFIFGSPLAMALKCAFVPIRRARRLPGDTVGVDYTSGFTNGRLEMHKDSIAPGSRVIILDDMVATGKTLSVMYELVTKVGATVVECGCVMDAKHQHNETWTNELPLFALITYDKET